MRQIKDLQKLIEGKASWKLQRDLQELHNILYKHPLLNRYGESIPPGLLIARTSSEVPKRHFAYDLLSKEGGDLQTDNSYRGDLYRFWLPIYIERETKNLLDRADELTTKVNDLIIFKEDQEDKQC